MVMEEVVLRAVHAWRILVYWSDILQRSQQGDYFRIAEVMQTLPGDPDVMGLVSDQHSEHMEHQARESRNANKLKHF